MLVEFNLETDNSIGKSYLDFDIEIVKSIKI